VSGFRWVFVPLLYRSLITVGVVLRSSRRVSANPCLGAEGANRRNFAKTIKSVVSSSVQP